MAHGLRKTTQRRRSEGIEVNRPADFSSSTEERRREADLSNAIREYIAAHPHAMDTLEGIAEWWMGASARCADFETLARVLERLVQQGLLEEIGSGPRKLYRPERRS
jgi:hypothetical protein